MIIWDACKTRNNYLDFDMSGMIIKDASGNKYGYPFVIGQYIPWFNGGYVYAISNDGANGEMVSREGSTGTHNDAYNWCRNYGANWNVPSIGTLKTIYYSGCGVSLSGNYWSGNTSYDSSTRKTWYLYLENGWEAKTTQSDKIFNIRAVRSF